jgi:hypothetical protein
MTAMGTRIELPTQIVVPDMRGLKSTYAAVVAPMLALLPADPMDAILLLADSEVYSSGGYCQALYPFDDCFGSYEQDLRYAELPSGVELYSVYREGGNMNTEWTERLLYLRFKGKTVVLHSSSSRKCASRRYALAALGKEQQVLVDAYYETLAAL